MKNLLTLAPLVLLTACGSAERSARLANMAGPGPLMMNDRVLAAISDIGRNDKNLGYSLEENGQHTRSLFYRGEQVFSRGSRKSHCVGMTFQILMQALGDYFTETGDTRVWNQPAEAMRWTPFKDCWYINGDCTSAGFALQRYGMGTASTDLSTMKAGDFVQFWRTTGSGHSVVFLNFIDGSDRLTVNYPEDMIGFEYFSSQGTTNGAGWMRAYFDGVCKKDVHPNADCKIIRTSVTAGRLWEPSQFQAMDTSAFLNFTTPYNSSRLFQ